MFRYCVLDAGLGERDRLGNRGRFRPGFRNRTATEIHQPRLALRCHQLADLSLGPRPDLGRIGFHLPVALPETRPGMT
ncbi:hypothetical protein KXR53_14375 [Inquilinus limosus]|uniref:hypothetical protein n=1 Tax=Inquilinus limosus TaxID=171674 RepID=UPI003F178597